MNYDIVKWWCWWWFIYDDENDDKLVKAHFVFILLLHMTSHRMSIQPWWHHTPWAWVMPWKSFLLAPPHWMAHILRDRRFHRAVPHSGPPGKMSGSENASSQIISYNKQEINPGGTPADDLPEVQLTRSSSVSADINIALGGALAMCLSELNQYPNCDISYGLCSVMRGAKIWGCSQATLFIPTT